MAKDLFLWNKNKTASVRASMIREIHIYRKIGASTDEYFEVTGWFNKEEDFCFGFFETEDEARMFVRGLHRQIKEA